MEKSVSNFENLFLTNYQHAARIAYYLVRDKAKAEDVVQEVFLKLWQSHQALEKAKDPKAYILRAVKNQALDLVKSEEASKKKLTGYFQLRLKESSENDNSLALDKVKSVIEKYVNELPPRCRLIFSMSRFEGLTNDEIANYLDISKRTVETQISYAVKKLKEHLKNDPTLFLTIAVLALLLLL